MTQMLKVDTDPVFIRLPLNRRKTLKHIPNATLEHRQRPVPEETIPLKSMVPLASHPPFKYVLISNPHDDGLCGAVFDHQVVFDDNQVAREKVTSTLKIMRQVTAHLSPADMRRHLNDIHTLFVTQPIMNMMVCNSPLVTLLDNKDAAAPIQPLHVVFSSLMHYMRIIVTMAKTEEKAATTTTVLGTLEADYGARIALLDTWSIARLNAVFASHPDLKEALWSDDRTPCSSLSLEKKLGLDEVARVFEDIALRTLHLREAMVWNALGWFAPFWPEIDAATPAAYWESIPESRRPLLAQSTTSLDDRVWGNILKTPPPTDRLVASVLMALPHARDVLTYQQSLLVEFAKQQKAPLDTAAEFLRLPEPVTPIHYNDLTVFAQTVAAYAQLYVSPVYQ